jgi:hypothetical protein
MASSASQTRSVAVAGTGESAVDFTPKGGPLSVAAFDAQAAPSGLSDLAHIYSADATNTIHATTGNSTGNLATTDSFVNSSLVVKFVAALAGPPFLNSRLGAGGSSIGVFFNSGAGEVYDSYNGWHVLGGITTGMTAGTTYYAKLDTQTVDAQTTKVTITFLGLDGSVISSNSFTDTNPGSQGVSGPDSIALSPNGIGILQMAAYRGVRSNSIVLGGGGPTPTPTASSAPTSSPTPTPAPTATATPTSIPTKVPSPTPTPTQVGGGGSTIPEGLYESCGMIWVPQTCFTDLDTFKAAGFTRVINYSELQATAAEFQEYLTHAASDGIGVIVSLNSVYNATNISQEYPDLSKTCPSPCTTPAQFATYVATLSKGNPGVWGYYIGDETQPSAQNESETDAVYNAVKTVDPTRPTLFVGATGFNTDLNTLTNLVGPFVPYMNVIGADHYSIGADGDETGATQLPFSQSVHSLATSSGKPSALVLQAFGFYEYNTPYCSPYPACAAFPTETQMHTLYENALLGDPNVSMIFWYSYMDIQRSSNPAGNWANLQAAIHG